MKVHDGGHPPLLLFPLTFTWHWVQDFLITLLQARRHISPFSGCGMRVESWTDVPAQLLSGTLDRKGLHSRHTKIQAWQALVLGVELCHRIAPYWKQGRWKQLRGRYRRPFSVAITHCQRLDKFHLARSSGGENFSEHGTNVERRPCTAPSPNGKVRGEQGGVRGKTP